MSYIVFARKYRPQDFDEIIGQSHITTTLKNAIEQSRVAHAYLFAGPRGVGKTTTARILAKALNCEKGPTTKPCNKCASCLEITSGSNLDILEIDGASNRGIDEIRSLRENAKFTPAKGKFKLYIIDEVHMLTGEAFNALLKTLEEPPAHVKFIFATTHAYKVPPTILSRCQRFDFRRIPITEILDNLKSIAREEKLGVSDEALSLIAKYGDGSMRDSQVILDQIASFTPGKVGVDDVTKVLGIVDDEILFALSGAICGKDPAAALKIIDGLVRDGKDVMQVVLGLIEHFRNISIAKICKDLKELIDAGSDKIKRYEIESAGFTIEQILYIIYTFSNTIDFIRKTSMSRIPLEAALVKLTQNAGIMPIADIMKRLEALEDRASHPVVKAQPKNIAMDLPARQSFNFDEILSSWTKVISWIKNKKISIASYLQEGNPISLEGGIMTIGFAKEFQFHKEVLESNDNRKLIETAIKEMFGLDIRVVLTVTGSVAPRGASVGEYIQDADDVGGGSGAVSEEADPIVRKALEMFDGKLASNGSPKGRMQ